MQGNLRASHGTTAVGFLGGCLRTLSVALISTAFALGDSARIEAAESDAQTWYREGKGTPPRIQLATDNPARDGSVFRDLQVPEVLAQLKHDLATNKTLDISASDRANLLAILDDPNMRLVYTGKQSLLAHSTGGQAIDKNTVNINSEGFLRQGAPKPLPEIAAILLHEIGHISQLRNNLFNLPWGQESWPEELEAEVGKAADHFEPDRLRELGKTIAAGPGAPAPTADAGPPPGPVKTPPAPTDDPTLRRNLDALLHRLDGALADADNRLGKHKAQCDRTAEAVRPSGPNSIAERTAKLKAEAENLVAPLRRDPVADQAEFTRSSELADALERISDRLAEVADQVCVNSRLPKPDMQSSRSGLDQARKIGFLADQMAREAKDLAGGLLGRLNKSVADVDPLPLKQKIRNSGRDHLAFCGSVVSLNDSPDVALGDARQVMGELAAGVAEAESGKLTPELAAAYRQEMNARDARISSMTGRVDKDVCEGNRREAENQCKTKFNATDAVVEAMILVEEVMQALVDQRKAQVNRVRALSDRLATLADRGTAAALAAGQCHKTAESKKPAVDPKLVAEADGLGDPANTTCDASKLRSRAAQLRDTRFADVPGIKDRIDNLERLAGLYDQANAAWDRAKAAYNRGETPIARSELDEAQAKVNAIGGKPDCSAKTQKIASARDKTDRLENALSRGEETLRQCVPATMAAHRQAIDDKTNHPALDRLSARIAVQLAALERFNATRAALKSGRLADARGALAAAESAIKGAPQGDCRGLRSKIAESADAIKVVARASADADSAIASCDMGGVQTRAYMPPDTDFAELARQLRSRLDAGLETCRRKEEDRQESGRKDRCRKDRGAGYSPSKPDAGGTYYCIPNQVAADAWCNANNPGSGWKAAKITAKGTFVCNKSPQQLQSENNAICRNKYGAGYRAGKANSKGVFSCIPDRATANARCRQANGPGAIAGRIKGDGSFNCNWTSRARSQQAWAACRRQYGSRLADVKIFKNGSYQCIYNTGQVARQPRHNPQSSAAAAAAAGALMQGVLGAINRSRGGGGGGGHTPSAPSTKSQPCNVHDPLTSNRGCY
jgi:hypothetical protein